METKAELFTSEQLQTALMVIAVLVVTNGAAILGWIGSYFKRRDDKFEKMQGDLNAAFVKIRVLETKLEIEGEKENGISNTLLE